MIQNNSEAAVPNPGDEPGKRPIEPQPAPTKKKRRWVLKSIIGLVVLILLLVLLAPSIISTGVVRDVVVGQINSSSINGKLAIKDWSFGWTSGVHIDGVTLNDANNEHLLSIAEISTPLSLAKAATGNIDLGDVTIKGVDVNAVIDPSGQLNFAKVFKPSNKPPSNQPSRLPNVKGTIHVTEVTGTFEDDPDHTTVGIPQENPLNVTVAIPDIDQPIQDTIDLGLKVDEKNFALVKISGTVLAIQNRYVDIDHLAADQTIELSQGDLSAVTQTLHAMGLDLTVTGNVDGKIMASVKTLKDISADGTIEVANASVGGKQMEGDTLAYRQIQVKMDASVGSAIKVDMPVTLQPNGAGQPDQVNVHADIGQDSLSGLAGALKAIVQQASSAATIPGSGKIEITANWNVANLMSQAPHLLHAQQGTTLTSGELAHETTITVADGKAVVVTQTQLKNFAGTTGGTPLRLDNISVSGGVTAVGGDHPELRDIKVSLTSDFASFDGGGETLAKTSFQGKSDLQSLQQQFGQVIDFDSALHATPGQHVSMAGTIGFDAHTSGDLIANQGDLAVGADFNMTNVKIVIPGKQTIDEPKLAVAVSGNIPRGAAESGAGGDRRVDVTVQSPSIDFAIDSGLAAGGSFGVTPQSVSITRGSVDLPLLQQEIGGALALFVPAGAAGQAPTLPQLIAENQVVCTSGKLAIAMSATFEGSTITMQKPLTLNIANLTLQRTGGGAPIDNQTLAAAIGGSVELGGAQIHANLQPIDLEFGDQLKIAGDPQAPVDISMAPTGTISASGNVQIHADLPKLIATAAIAIPPEQMESLDEMTGGDVDGKIQLKGGDDANSVSADLMVSSLTVAQALTNESIHLTASASLAQDMSAIHDVNVGIDTSFAKKISIANGQIILQTRQGDKMVPVGMLDQLQSADVDIDEVNLAKVDALVNVMFNQAATPGPGEKAVVVVPPPTVTSGMATMKMSVSHSGNATTANISNVLVSNLAITSNGNVCTWPHDITAKLQAEVDAALDSGAVSQASITALSVDTGIGTTLGLADQKPIVATNLADPSNMAVQGGISLDGDIAQAARVAEMFGGAKANSYPYQGQLHLSESISKIGSQPRLHLQGGGTISKFVVMGQPGPNGAPAQPVFSENNISISNPLDFDFKTFSLIIGKNNPIAIALESTGALGVKLTGTINDLPLKRQIADDNKIVISLKYDLAKLWPIVKPMLSPSQQQTFADLTIGGQQERTFTVSGSYPADQPFNRAIVSLNAGGYLTVDSLSTQGITVNNLDVPFTLSQGILRTVYPDRPDGSNVAPPASCNGGTLDLGTITVDLRTDPMLAYISGSTAAGPHYILKNVSINPALSKSVLSKVLNNPAFVGANNAQGLLSIAVMYADRLPLSDLFTQASPQNQGAAELQYSVTGLQLGSPLLAVFGNASVAAEINNADVKLAAGRVTEDTTLMIDGNKPLRFAGVVVLATKQFAPMTVYIPPALFAKLIPPQSQQYIPDVVVVPLKGDMDHPQIDLSQAIAQTVKQGAQKAIINGLLNGLQHVH